MPLSREGHRFRDGPGFITPSPLPDKLFEP